MLPRMALALMVLLATTVLGAGRGGKSEKASGSAKPDRPLTRGIVPPLFATSDRCIACHNNLSTVQGEDVSIGADWRASMMANSARDPYWQATVRREVLDHPSARAAIEDECSKCHMPMARYQAHAEGGQGEIFAHLPVGQATATAARLAADGVSCTACHQIRDEKLGTRESFVGGFVVDETSGVGNREIFGPYEVDPGRTTIMRSAARFKPAESSHIQSSELCATCHTLYTHTLDETGKVIGELPEQVPYLEWRHSAFRDTKSCQDCHMPVVEAETPITGVWGQPRQGFSRHVFRGGNFFMLRMLKRYRQELGVVALPEELETAALRTVSHLETLSAQLALESVQRKGDRLETVVQVANLAGHKLPTAYPSRRAWLRFRVVDAAGSTVFESGGFRKDGSIEGNDNDADPERFERHYQRVESPEEVQIYENILVDSRDRVTTGLLSGLRFIKDNRLLPEGFDKSSAEADIAVRGAASQDEDFQAPGDRILYSVAVGEHQAPFTVQAELWYQPIGYRWAQNLSGRRAEETDRFVRYYESMSDSSAVILARASGEIH